MNVSHQALARSKADRLNLDAALVCAIIEQESRWNPWAWNPEPRYHHFWDVKLNRPFRKLTPEEITSEIPPADFPFLAGDRDQEWWAQQASWGLMQVMGAVARERGFTGHYLMQTLAPEINIEYGCRHFSALLESTGGDARMALLRWNGGGNSNYPDEVLARIGRYRG